MKRTPYQTQRVAWRGRHIAGWAAVEGAEESGTDGGGQREIAPNYGNGDKIIKLAAANAHKISFCSVCT